MIYVSITTFKYRWNINYSLSLYAKHAKPGTTVTDELKEELTFTDT